MAPTNLSSLLRSSPKPSDAGAYRIGKPNPPHSPEHPSDSIIRDDAAPPAAAVPAAPAATPPSDLGDLTSIRGILLGSLPDELTRQIERFETTIAQSAAHQSEALSALEQRLEVRIADVEAANRSLHGALRQQLLEELRVVNDSVVTYHAKAMQRIEDGLRELNDAKLDHATFSSFLQSLARYLNREDETHNDAQEAR